MRNILFSLASLLVAIAAIAQEQKGVYLTEADFLQNKLSFTKSQTEGKYKIIFNEYFQKPYITIKQDRKKTYLFKDEIFGYRNNKQVIRVWDQVPYTLVQRGPVWIYYRDLNFTNGKGYNTERKYFYSLNGSSSIMPLSRESVRRALNNGQISQSIIQSLRNREEIVIYGGADQKFNPKEILESISAD